jgi:hypothetical protein
MFKFDHSLIVRAGVGIKVGTGVVINVGEGIIMEVVVFL